MMALHDHQRGTHAQRPDFHRVDADQIAIHRRLENWARYVSTRRVAWMAPLWRMGKPLGRQWNAPEPKTLTNSQDGHAMELAVRQLPLKHREAIRWSYVYKGSPARIARQLDVTYGDLMQLVRSARNMLIATAP